jgi:hypothetical protein
LIPRLGQGIDGHETTQLFHRRSVLAALLETDGKRIEGLEHLGSEAVTMGFDPVVVDPRQQVATVRGDRCSELVDATSSRVLHRVLEVSDVQAEWTIRPPPDRPALDRQQAFSIRQRASESVELAPEIREGLSVARVRPQRERDLRPFKGPVPVEQEIGDEPRVPYRLDPVSGVGQGKVAEQLHFQHRPSGRTTSRR